MTILDMARLLAPISEHHPAGEDISFDPLYDQIREARRADADYLGQGEWVSALKQSNWAEVIRLTCEALATRSKDLQLAVWLCEALVQRHGLPGLRDGLLLLDSLLERYWAEMYPALSEGDLEGRVSRLEWLNQTLPPELGLLPLTAAQDGRAYGWLDWQISREVDNLKRLNSDAAQVAISEGKLDPDAWDLAVSHTPGTFYLTLQDALQQAIHAFQGLSQRLEPLFGRDAPRVSDVAERLEQMLRLVGRLVEGKGVTLARDAEEHAVAPAGAEASATLSPPSSGVAGAPRTREEAIRQLSGIAAFFRETEPHSPVSYIVDKAARWGNMRLDEWIREVVEDDGTRRMLKGVLGYDEE
ncbi:type VI secretion system protein TssA [Edwardsiella anguillarum]|uniref:type VI secretion system protein TssA n=1 Tax=Edwardsiella TaxID=635 RepID=UPI00045C9390|nr:type VI secretion system protein TssA [Edwardsiella anguillarum]AKM47295.1 type VI secretion protein [Edwardsiella sp. EA181011]GAJ65951.1 type VI secretion system protein EvpK [Edwardsiella piscicida]RFT02169.1 type VI secretion protein [Edwardsiella anguillarum]WHQ15066.1 type VI secretion system protein TssA [Edwardsiella anguillarum]BET81458.1 type VI secretion system protein TssA [Edwardsiella anguillarum]